jgi:N-acetylglutamate synthase-like GNAT family acetyltransferase
MFREASPDDWSDIREFYRETSYLTPITAADRIFLAELNGRIVGAVRLCSEGGVQVLRGMRVLQDMRGQHIGISLLRTTEEIIGGSPCYCIPHGYLEPLYGKVGFRKVTDELAPPFLRERLREYQARGLNVIIMFRDGGRTRIGT